MECRTIRDPVTQYLSDANALLRTDELPASAAARAVPLFCRLAMEAACTEVVRRRRIGRGEPHSDTDEVLNAARTLMPKLALALFDDAARTGEVLARINRSDSGWADAVRWANRGAHGSGDAATDLPPMVGATERLARWLNKQGVASMTPMEILAAADALVGPNESSRAHGWPRVVAVLARNAIEEALRQYWTLREPGMERCTWHAQLLCLTAYLSNRDLARATVAAWSDLSRACHHHPYELAPTVNEFARPRGHRVPIRRRSRPPGCLPPNPRHRITEVTRGGVAGSPLGTYTRRARPWRALISF